MINVDGVEYRNLEEQVQFLTDKYNGLDETFASKDVVNDIASVLNQQQEQITSTNQQIANVNQQVQTVDGKFANYVPIVGTQTLDAKIFKTEIAIQSPEGEVTRLKNINNNITLTNGNGVNLFNIDEQLQIMQVFGKTLATLEDIATGQGTKVTVAGQVQSTWNADSKADTTTVSTLSQTVSTLSQTVSTNSQNISSNTLAISGLAQNKADKTSLTGLASETWVNQQISAEATERQQEDSNLQSQITTLDSTTSSLDTRLSQASSQISAESTTRQNSDALLQAQIDSIVSSGTTSNGFWTKYSDGTLIVGGRISNLSGEKTITLPSPFANTNYYVVWGMERNSSTNQTFRTMGAWSKTTTSFNTYCLSALDKVYVAYGEWK